MLSERKEKVKRVWDLVGKCLVWGLGPAFCQLGELIFQSLSFSISKTGIKISLLKLVVKSECDDQDKVLSECH